MNDLRSEIQAAFEKEQAMYPPRLPLTLTLFPEGAREDREGRGRTQWVAAVAALVIGALVVIGLMSTRLSHRPAVPAATPHATASPVGDYGPPPAGVPLFYLGDAAHPGWYIGFDWNGTPRGTIKLGQTVDPNAYLIAAPDGQMFDVGPVAKGGSGQFLDRLGNPTSTVPPGPMLIWADDNKHMCGVALDQNQFTWTLVTDAPGEAQRAVTLIARDQGVGQTGISLLACSFKNDRAVALRTTIAWPAELWVIRLSDGKLMSHSTYTDGKALLNVIASPDGTLTAENSGQSTGGVGPFAPSTVVRRLSDGSVVASLDPSLGVLGFSADNSLALVNTTPGGGRGFDHVAVVEVKTGKVLWHFAGANEALGGFYTEPTGATFALMIQNTLDPTSHPQVRVVVVFADGQSAGIPGTFAHP
jgi:hypothetical protein